MTAISAHTDERILDQLFAAIDQGRLPGAAVAIAVDGVPVYRRGFGLANMELPVLLSPSMRMRVGSTTKHFAALAYMLLVEEGRAGIDDPVGRHVAGLHPVTARVTMRQLMGHVGGVRDLLSITMTLHGIGRAVSEKELLAYYATIDDADFEPGTHWSYNNGGYSLVAAAIEAITGETLDTVLRTRIFTPVGMHDTLLRRWDSDFVPNCATLHFRDASGAFSRTYMGMELSAAGGMVSTMDDMLLWLRHMDAPTVGSADTWATMRTPQRLANGTSTGYGLGLFSETYRGVELLHHAGSVLAGNSQMIKVPAAGLDISIAANRSDLSSGAYALAIIDLCVDGLDPPGDTPDFEKRSGSFVSKRDGRVVTLSVFGEMQLMSVDGGPAIPMTPDGADMLRLPASLGFLQQCARIDGDAMHFTDFGDEDVLDRVEPEPEATLGAHEGLYRSDALDATITVEQADDGPRATTRGRHGAADYRLSSITADIWRIEQTGFAPMSAILTFDRDGAGLTLDLTRLRHVRFAKIG